MSNKPWGNRSEATKGQSDRMERLHKAMAPFRKSVSGYKKLRQLLPAYLPMQIGKTLKDCAVSVSVLTDEKPAVLLKLIRELNNAATAQSGIKKNAAAKNTSRKVTVKKKQALSPAAKSKQFADSLTTGQINKAAPYVLKQLKNGDWAIKLGAIVYLRFDGIVWARYYCETLNSGYRDLLRELKESKNL